MNSVGFNPGTGITGILTPQTEDICMPRQSGLSPALSSSRTAPGLETYDGRNLDSIIDAALQPQCSDPDLMTPSVFNKTLQSGLQKLETGTKNADLARLNTDIIENSNMLKTYENLVISG